MLLAIYLATLAPEQTMLAAGSSGVLFGWSFFWYLIPGHALVYGPFLFILLLYELLILWPVRYLCACFNLSEKQPSVPGIRDTSLVSRAEDGSLTSLKLDSSSMTAAQGGTAYYDAVVPASVLSFTDLEKDLQKRSDFFPYYARHLEQQNPRLLHWIGSVSYSGHDREASLRYLITHYQAGDENRILLRLEDWVPEVAQLAEDWYQTHFLEFDLVRLEASNSHRVLRYLLNKEKRWLSGIQTCLKNDIQLMLLATDQPTFMGLTAAFRHNLYQIGLGEDTRLRDWLCHDPAVENRYLLLQYFSLVNLSTQEQQALIHDPATRIRRAYLQQLILRPAPISAPLLRHFCLDQQRNIREVAQFYLFRDHQQQADSLYRQQQGLAFYYLSDYARREDWPLFLRGLGSKNSRIRYLCLKAICQLDANYLRQLDPIALVQENRRIRNLCRPYLAKILTTAQIIAAKPVLLTIGKQRGCFYLTLLHSCAYYHFLNEALALMPTRSGACHGYLCFLQQKKGKYGPISKALAAKILANIQRLRAGADAELNAFLDQVQFIIKTAPKDDLDSLVLCQNKD